MKNKNNEAPIKKRDTACIYIQETNYKWIY